ncbi:MAG: 4Fe-4S binding protein [Myxococcales bacterium]|nr:4Fe-4S binding protein [Myxococcales bacterium]
MSAALTDAATVQPSNHTVLRASLRVGLMFLAPGMLIMALRDRPIATGWLGLVLTFGPLLVFGLLYIWVTYRGTTPGIKNDGLFFNEFSSRKFGGIALGVVITGFYVVLYWFPEYLGFIEWGKPARGLIVMLEPLSQAMRGTHADQWFLYGFLYTMAVLVMGVRMFYRYRHNRYQLWRTGSVMFFQLGFAFTLPALLMMFGQPEFYFTYFWPLKYDYLFPGTVHDMISKPGGVGLFMIGWGVIASFLLTPLLTWRFGKRWYCSWVCGCGGLAETAGDPFRQLSSKKISAWRFERWSIHLVLVFITVVTAMLWIDSASEGGVFGEAAQSAKKVYGFAVGALLSGVVGVGFYPLLGSRVWCRFFCPMAAILGLFQRFFSRFRITTNGGQCMSCGNCSTYCEMGIDVRAYAMRGENIVRASCVGCGICAAVCPRGVLKLESGATHKDRFAGAEHPLSDLIGAIKRG